MNRPPVVAVLMTCHNRREKTLRALHALRGQCGLPPGCEVRVHLVDADSRDGTPQAVAEHFPEVAVVPAGDDVFWNAGMRIAADHALAAGPADYLLWLNDDVELDAGALALLLTTATAQEAPAVAVGATRSRRTGTTTYSGHRLHRRGLRPRTLTLVEPGRAPLACDTCNGNAVLVPAEVHRRLGGLDPAFSHGMGDFDFGFRASRAGCTLAVAPGHIGFCESNPPLRGSREPGLGLREALRRVASRRELPPREWWVYCRRHHGAWALPIFCSPYARTALRALRARWAG
ncbi:glycosyltransferase family 2 protein [Kitasatospora arboriphila]|uniref:Glycosyltransferase n=1 Tax=Kitasatospora arboriphila TaxID=258052 RepID=A0ABP4EEX3_9ACTN